MKVLKKIDIYIIKKFLGTYFFAIALILAITVMFDINEKLDSFLKAPLSATIFDYFFNFLPYFANLFSPLFTFIAVIFFTSKLADNSEIIAMLSSGISFKRLFVPYMISAAIIAALNLYLSCYVIPPANVTRIEYTNTYVKNKRVDYASNIQLQVEPGVIAYISRYDNSNKTGYRFSLEKFDKKVLKSRLTAQTINYDSAYHWRVNNYLIRNFNGMREELVRGTSLDTIVPIEPSDFLISQNDSEMMTRHGRRLVYPHGHRHVALFAQGEGGHGYQHRYRVVVELLLHLVLDRHLDLCRVGSHVAHAGHVDSQHHLYGDSRRAV